MIALAVESHGLGNQTQPETSYRSMTARADGVRALIHMLERYPDTSSEGAYL